MSVYFRALWICDPSARLLPACVVISRSPLDPARAQWLLTRNPGASWWIVDTVDVGGVETDVVFLMEERFAVHRNLRQRLDTSWTIELDAQQYARYRLWQRHIQAKMHIQNISMNCLPATCALYYKGE
jgi:hypothetical protein